jgi:omega-6 fatty acid desaturase (delta-12 desaturase)
MQLVVSVAGFVICWVAAYQALDVGYWLTLLLAVPGAGFMMRLFMIQHDCGHGSFFRSKRAARIVGGCIGVLLMTPYGYWRKTHAIHHAHSGDLDLRGFGDVDTMTVDEYLALPWKGRLWYRIYRNPWFLFGPGAYIHFFLKHRYPIDLPREWKREWASVWRTNVALLLVVVAMSWLVGFKAFVMVQLPMTLLACSLGVWLFYVQHQYEDTYWHRHEDWDYFDAAVQGSSHLALPKPLQWITANIGLHHVHHLSARIPNYKLQQAHDENPEFQVATRLSLRDTLGCISLVLWDERNHKMIRFRDVKAYVAAS